MKASKSPLFSCASDDWGTPAEVFDPLHAHYDFTIDGAANSENHKCPRWLGPGGLADNALTYDWCGERLWLNPPYSLCKEFLEKAAFEAVNYDVLSVVLIPSRTDTRYFHDYVWEVELAKPYLWVKSINFLKGRVKFISSERIRKGSSNSAPFPSLLVEFGGY